MPVTPAPIDHPPATARLERAWYSVIGVPVAVACADADAFGRVDETYAAFREAGPAPTAAVNIQLLSEDNAYLVCDAGGYRRAWPDAQAGLIDLLGRMVHNILAGLHRQGIYAIHAGAAVYREAALVVAGQSGQGKTTLTLGLLRRGLGLLSDEFAVVAPDSPRILPYRRSLHIRPGTPELIPELRFLHDRPRRQLGGGIEWPLTLDDLESAFPGCLAEAAPLGAVLLLDGGPRVDQEPVLTPVPAALATLELLRGTWAASVDFEGGLARIGQLLSGAACARLRAGALEPTLDCIIAWLEGRRG